MANIKFTMIVVVALLIITSFEEVNGLKCIQCGVSLRGDDDCKETAEIKGESKECNMDSLTPGFKPGCHKIINEGGKKNQRFCANMGEDGCHSSKDVSWELCMCDSEDCNGVGRLRVQISIFSIVILFPARFVFFIGG